jgi:hypothetical protein
MQQGINLGKQCLRLVLPGGQATHTSNDRKKGEGNSKCGNRCLAWADVEAATDAARFSAPLRAWFQRKAARAKRDDRTGSTVLGQWRGGSA